tara:strand:- start:1167 stop:1307 length:141 start_codon:yes stop_codon:yes gene_type:complete
VEQTYHIGSGRRHTVIGSGVRERYSRTFYIMHAEREGNDGEIEDKE